MGVGLFEPMHIIVILIIALLVFGPGKLANLGHDLGKGIRDFKKAMNEPEVIEIKPAQAAEAVKKEGA